MFSLFVHLIHFTPDRDRDGHLGRTFRRKEQPLGGLCRVTRSKVGEGTGMGPGLRSRNSQQHVPRPRGEITYCVW